MWHLQCDMKQKPSSSPRMKNDNGERALFFNPFWKTEGERETERQNHWRRKTRNAQATSLSSSVLEVIIVYWTCTWWYRLPLLQQTSTLSIKDIIHQRPIRMERDSCRSWSFWIEDMFEEYLRNTWDLIDEWWNSKRYKSAHVNKEHALIPSLLVGFPSCVSSHGKARSSSRMTLAWLLAQLFLRARGLREGEGFALNNCTDRTSRPNFP